MSGGVSESSEVEYANYALHTPATSDVSAARSRRSQVSGPQTIRRYVGEYGRHTNMARGGGALSGETLGALCDQIVWRGRVAAWHSNSQLPTPISTAHPGSRLPRTDARSSSGGYST